MQPSFDSTSAEHVRNLDEVPFWSAPFGLILLETIRIRRNMHVLDIGSGTGFPLIEIAERLGTSSRLVGIDPWIEALNRIKEKILLRGLTNVELHAIPSESLPFDSGSFDLIVSNNGLNNVQDLPKVLSECRRVCKPDAQLVFTVNLPDTMIEFYSILEQIAPDAKEKIREHIHLKRRPLDEWESLLTEAGFRITEKKLSSFTYRFADANAMFSYHTIREFFLPSWKEILSPHNVTAVFSQLEQSLNEKARAQGEIRLTVPFVCFECACS
jgi:ubiquinone/menaquinone biosynthesis C-methylase UbiE